ncbi:MAG: hypothetical protein ACI8XM_001998 [Haloarculaceae archaeon]|jgi:hypothetical protein
MVAKRVRDQHGTQTTGRLSIQQQIDNHLSRAIEAEGSDLKNYHIRSARQLLVTLEYKTAYPRPDS